MFRPRLLTRMEDIVTVFFALGRRQCGVQVVAIAVMPAAPYHMEVTDRRVNIPLNTGVVISMRFFHETYEWAIVA